MKSRSDKIVLYMGLTFVIVLVGVHFWHGLNRRADPDEFQMIVNAFDASRGLMPYVDFWDNHGPLNITLLKPILSLYQTDHALIYWLRTLVWVNTLFIAVLTYLIWNLFHPRQSPFFALAFLLGAPPFLAKSLEVRTDNLVNLLTTLALGLLAFGVLRRQVLAFCLAGFCVGLAAGFTLKFTIVAAGLAFFVLMWYAQRRQWPRVRDLAGAVGCSALTVALLFAVYYTPEFWLCYFEANSTRGFAGFTSSDFLNIYKKAPVWSGLATVVLGLAGFRAVTGRALSHETGLLVMVGFYLVQYFLFLPTKYMQSLLPVYVPLALLAGSVLPATWRAICGRWGLPAVVTPVVVVFGLGFLVRDIADYNQIGNRQLPRQVSFANEVLKQTRGEGEIFDPGGIVFLKPKPGRFHVLVTFLRDLHLSEKIDLGVVELLATRDVHTVIFDSRAQDLRGSDVVYLRNNYTPVLAGPDCLMLSRNDVIESAPENLPGKTFQRWRLGELEGGKVPDATGDPGWFYRYAEL